MLGLSNTLANSGRMATPFYMINKYSVLVGGTDEYIRLGAPVTAGTSSTLGIWIKRDAIADDAFLWGNASSGSGYYTAYIAGDSGQITIRFDDSYVTLDDSAVTTALNVTTWIHVVIVRTGVYCDLYVNGVKKGPTIDSSGVGGGFSGNTSIDTIGAKGNNTKSFEGNIKDASLWNVALNAVDDTAILAIYNSGTPMNLKYNSGAYNGFTDNLVGWWRMGDGTSSTSFPVIGDESNPNVLGQELLITTGWSVDTGWGLSAGVLTYNDSENGMTSLTASEMTNGTGLATGQLYQLKYTIGSLSTGATLFVLYDDDANTITDINGSGIITDPNGTFYHYFYATSSHNGNGFSFYGNTGSGSSFTLSDYSLKAISGGTPGIMTNMESGDIEEDTPPS